MGIELSDPRIKVNDRRLFTPAGDLREEYRYLETGAQAEAPPPAAPQPGAPQPAAPQPGAPQPVAPQPSAGEESEDFGGATFFDLLGLVANPVPLYLDQARYGGPEAAESIEMAHLHVDLLGVLRQKTAGNLGAEEQAALDEVLYRLRMAVVGR